MVRSKLMAIDKDNTLAISRGITSESDQEILGVLPTQFADKIKFEGIYRELSRRLVIDFQYNGYYRRAINVGRAVLEVLMGVIIPEDHLVHHIKGQWWNLVSQLEVVHKRKHPRGKEYDGDVISGLSALLGYTAAEVDRIIKNLNFLMERFPDARYIKPVDGISLADCDLTVCPDWREMVDVVS